MYVKFIVSPTGKHNLAYSPGEEAEIDDDLGLLLVTEGFARRVTPLDPPTDDENSGGGEQGEQPDPPTGDEKPEDRTDKKPKEKR